VTALHVWWTISGSDVAWEWAPGEAVVCAGRVVSAGGTLRFVAAEEWAPMWTSERTRAGFQAFKDLTALFAEEANVLPGDVRIFWLAGERAVSWCRSTGALCRYGMAGSAPGAIALAGERPVGEGTTGDLRTADARARAALGI
jgi:hypothetical protein